MDRTQIIIVAVTLGVVAFRLYQKYGKKNKPNGGDGAKTSTGSSFPSTTKNDDYEPYARK
jgi:hypothetical protein